MTTTKRITEPAAIKSYASQVMQIRAMLANLAEFADSLPAPNDENGDECISGFDYGTLGSLNSIHSCILAASETADEMFGE